MSTIDDFFNYSKFEVRDAGGNTFSIDPDVQTFIKLEIYDAVGVDKMAGVTGQLYYKDGRNEEVIPNTLVTMQMGSCGLVNAIFTIALADWQENKSIVLKMKVTSRSAFVYELEYQVKG